MDYLQKIITDIETHSVDGIIECFKNGVSPNEHYNNKPLIYELISGYARGTSFKECVRAFVEHGLAFEDQALLAVLLDDANALQKEITGEHSITQKRYQLKSAFTPLEDVTLLHIAAEFNHQSVALLLLKNGADVNAKAGTDKYGFGGHTPIFQTVNQHNNCCVEVMDQLLAHHADVNVFVRGILWGKDYPWETFIPCVNPISYAMMGLLPQMQRKEHIIFGTISKLLDYTYDIRYIPHNVPNAYLKGSTE